jgi:ACS family D-galactonate transporter-like MFS transporter
MYREPHESTTVNRAELDYIAAGGGLEARGGRERTAFSWSRVRALLRFRQMWGACLGQFGGNSTLVFFLTWFPTYLATERHMGWIKIGFFAVMPFLAAAVGVMFGAWASDALLKRTGSANIARKLPIIAGLLGASAIITANYVEGNVAVIAILSVAFFAQGMTGLGWALISDIAPKNLMGLTGGVFNFAANLAGIVTPLVIGFIVAATGSFFYALAYVGAVALIGALSYIFILGDVKRMEVD